LLLEELRGPKRYYGATELRTVAPLTGPASSIYADPGFPGGGCTGSYIVTFCEDGHPSLRPVSCGRHGCQACADATSSKRGGRVLEKSGGRGFARYVVTTPAELRPYVNHQNQRQISRLIFDLIQSWYRAELIQPDLELGATIAMHPCGEDPLVYKPHWELFLPLIGEAGSGLVKLPWIMQLEGLKADLAIMWEALGEAWGHVYDQTLAENVYYEFVKAPGKDQERIHLAKHRTTYAFRTFPSWHLGGWRWTIQKLGLCSPRGEPTDEWIEAVTWTPPDQVCECGKAMLPGSDLLWFWKPIHAEFIRSYYVLEESKEEAVRASKCHTHDHGP